jgi:hypothetical protein
VRVRLAIIRVPGRQFLLGPGVPASEIGVAPQRIAEDELIVPSRTSVDHQV